MTDSVVVGLEKDAGVFLGDAEKLAAHALVTALGPMGLIIAPFLPEIPKILQLMLAHTGQAMPAPLATVLAAMETAMAAK